MCLAFLEKLIHRAATRGDEQKLARIGIEELDFILGCLGELDKIRFALKVARMFCKRRTDIKYYVRYYQIQKKFDVSL